MAKDGSVAPKERINIVYKAATGDGKEEIELPNKIVMLGDYTLREEEEDLQDRELIDISKDNFSDVMASQRLSVQMTVPNKLSGEEDAEISANLSFNNLRDFEPESVVKQVPELAKLLELREALSFLKGPLGNVPAFRKQIEELLGDDDSRRKLMAELGIDEE
ncbi:type VI secretion system contractile sheath small subunit [Amphritea pacifica]|uniref:Type VI secretion system contractile sheath small subunit n=1 Tax=Amphritea pacifica TaxID=2811233 RepID=A0ABS2W5B7_9GAMM|nr:type VI secretion system contractile sheath small subunit [Amphritea pacifica]MBN0986912.1 type VI secretion system contractile sheath small subunit [Amphritea pacifica]MBN1005365.1 type VI secretion system contractile sheath small subunit [Amphritea pacifica]